MGAVNAADDVATDVFSRLVKRCTGETAGAAPAEQPEIKGLNKTDRMLVLLQNHGRLTAEQLTTMMNLDLRLVWGLMKGPLERGQVHRVGSAFELNEAFIPTKVIKAVALLRGLGYQVEPPARQANANG